RGGAPPPLGGAHPRGPGYRRRVARGAASALLRWLPHRDRRPRGGPRPGAGAAPAARLPGGAPPRTGDLVGRRAPRPPPRAGWPLPRPRPAPPSPGGLAAVQSGEPAAPVHITEPPMTDVFRRALE